MPPPGLSMGLVPSRQRFLSHKNGTHPSFCLLSTSLNLEPITINNIHIIDLVYTCVITSFDTSFAPSVYDLARHLITYTISTKLSEI